MARALLVEVAATDRFHRAIAFPFVQGWLTARGIPVRWLRFGLPAAARTGSGESGIALPEKETGALLRAVQGRPTHVLFSGEPAASLANAVTSVAPAAKVGFLDDAAPFAGAVAPSGAEARPARVWPTIASIGSFFECGDGEVGDAGNLFEEAVPDFRWEAGNTAALGAPSVPFLICGEECTYRRGFGRNPHFAGLDLSRCCRRHGCAFCLRPAKGAMWRRDPVELFRRQIEALRRTHRPWTEPLAVRAVGEPVLRNVDRVCGVLGSLSGAPIHLLVDGRADAVVRLAGTLRAAAARLAGTPHALHFCLVGAESFSAEELGRYNKGIGWQTNLDAIATLLGLEEEFARSFGFSTWGGVSLILFSPWTRLRDLSLNLAIIRRARLLGLCGKTFTSRLRLYEALPLYPMAARDGLLASAYDDPMLDTARRNFYSDEVPWRFAEEGMEQVCRVMVRLGASDRSSDGVEGRDRIFAALARAGIDEWTPERRLALAEQLVDAAIERPSDDALRLLRAAVAAEGGAPRSRRRQHEAPLGLAMRAHGTAPRWAGRGREAPLGPTTPLLLAFELGLKPVVRIENPEADLGRDFRRLLSRRAPVLAERVRRLPGDEGLEIFLGLRRDEVDEAIALTNRMEGTADDDVWRAAARRVGALLGYPPCCVEAFASRPPSARESYAWIHLQNRLETPGRVSPLLNPGVDTLVGHVPCSLRCEATLARTKAVFEGLRNLLGAKAAAGLRRRLARPWLLFLDSQGAAVELVGTGRPDGRFRYGAGEIRGDDPVVTRAAAGNELVVGDQQMLVMRRGRLHAVLSGRAFVWWHARAVQPELFRRIVALRFAPRNERSGPEADPEVGERRRDTAWLGRFLSSVLRVGTSRAPSFEGFTVVGVEPEDRGRVRLRLNSGDATIRLVAARRREGETSYASFGPFGLFHPHDERIDTAKKDRAVRGLARYLERAVELARSRKAR